MFARQTQSITSRRWHGGVATLVQCFVCAGHTSYDIETMSGHSLLIFQSND